MAHLSLKKASLKNIYSNIYPWRTLPQFVEQLVNTLAYKSEDSSLIAIHKPFGVGVHNAKDENNKKQNQDKLSLLLQGSPKYSIDDALPHLTEALNLKQPLHVVKSIDRYSSGLVLLSNDPMMKTRVQKSLDYSRCLSEPSIGTRALTYGIPTIPGDSISERVGVELLEVDELGDYKEPVVYKTPSRKFRQRMDNDKKSFIAKLEIKGTNKELAVSYVELLVSKLKWDFPRCYISSKTSFILGDVRFSKRIKEILGKQMQVAAFKSSVGYDDNFEPLNDKLRHHLGVSKNASIPLMLDVHAIYLRHFGRKKDKDKDLIIQSPYVPMHFAATAERLNLQKFILP